tara:strand:+ start:152 stop:430 length:279 start_codon:yes stop_codon:yes gene_type:complete
MEPQEREPVAVVLAAMALVHRLHMILHIIILVVLVGQTLLLEPQLHTLLVVVLDQLLELVLMEHLVLETEEEVEQTVLVVDNQGEQVVVELL